MNSKADNRFPVWRAMLKRCYCSKIAKWEYYGGRGITVCDQWRGRGGFKQFCSDVGRRRSRNYQIDRIDGNKGYYPKNCRWLTRLQNIRHRTPKPYGYSLLGKKFKRVTVE